MNVSDTGRPPQMCTIEQSLAAVQITRGSVSGIFVRRTVNLVLQNISQLSLPGKPTVPAVPSLLVRLQEGGAIQQVVCQPHLNMTYTPRVVVLQVISSGANDLIGGLICHLIKQGMSAASEQPDFAQHSAKSNDNGLELKEAELPHRRAEFAKRTVPSCPHLQEADECNKQVLIKVQLINLPIELDAKPQNQQSLPGHQQSLPGHQRSLSGQQQSQPGNRQTIGNELPVEKESGSQTQPSIAQIKSNAKPTTTNHAQASRPSHSADTSITVNANVVSRLERQTSTVLGSENTVSKHTGSTVNSPLPADEFQKTPDAIKASPDSVKSMDAWVNNSLQSRQGSEVPVDNKAGITTETPGENRPNAKAEVPADHRVSARNDHAVVAPAQSNNSVAKGAAQLAAAMNQQPPPASLLAPIPNDSGPKQLPPIILPVVPPPDGGNRSAGEKKKSRKWFEERRDDEDDDGGESNNEWFEDEEDEDEDD